MPEPTFLHQVSLFRGLSQEEIVLVAEALSEWECARKQTLFMEGDDADALYIVKEGELEAVITGGVLSHIAIAHFKPGDTLGELALLDKAPRAAQVRCVTPSVVATLTREDFRRLGQQEPNIQRILYRNLARAVAAKLRENHARMRELANRDRHLYESLAPHFII